MKNTIPNLLRACEAVKAVAAARDGLTAAEIARATAASPASAFRIATSLSHAGFLGRVGNAYRLGPWLIELALRTLADLSLREVAPPVLSRLAEQTGETAHLAIPAGLQSLILDVCESANPVRAASRAGTLTSLHASATGKVFLAFRHGHELREALSGLPIEKRTRRTLTATAALRREVALIQARGYAVDNEECDEGVRCLAAPVRNAAGEVVAALGITASAQRFTRAREGAIARLVLHAAERLSSALAGRSAVDTPQWTMPVPGVERGA